MPLFKDAFISYSLSITILYLAKTLYRNYLNLESSTKQVNYAPILINCMVDNIFLSYIILSFLKPIKIKPILR